MSGYKGFLPSDADAFSLSHLDHPGAFARYAKRFAGEEIELEIRRWREKRSDRQHRAYHAMLAPWALQEGHLIDDLKRDCLRQVFGEREVVDAITGEVRQVLKQPHTSTLDKPQFAELMDRTVELAAGCGVILELPQEYKARKQAEARPRRKAAA